MSVAAGLTDSEELARDFIRQLFLKIFIVVYNGIVSKRP